MTDIMGSDCTEPDPDSVILQDLRKQHDEQVTFYKDELEKTFQAKVRTGCSGSHQCLK